MTPVILSGGSGTRLWPVSRTKFPKQFCDLFGAPMQSVTYQRLRPLGEPWILTSIELKTLTESGLRELGEPIDRVIYETVARNTAAAIALLGRVFELRGRADEIVGVFPSDHVIRDEEAFRRALRFAESVAAQGRIVTLGIRPDRPETGYGYIQTEQSSLSSADGLSSHRVRRFHEKPDLAKAESFLREGGFFWNAGIFVFRVSLMMQKLREHAPDVAGPFADLRADLSNLDEIVKRVPSISIDYALMEKLGGGEFLACVPVDIGWNDVGSWDAVADLQGPQKDVNVVAHGSEGFFVRAPQGKTVALVGVKDLNVIDTGDCLLIAARGQSQDVKHIVDQLKAQGSKVPHENPVRNYSWGRAETLREETQFSSRVVRVSAKEKVSTVNSGNHDEHWIVAAGKGELTLDGRAVSIAMGDHVIVPRGKTAMLHNISEGELCVIEVSLGNRGSLKE